MARAPLDEELVAYLDGELDAESGRRIEALLASDAAVRRRLQSLERTWDLLDELDAAPLGEPFTQTTLEMVAVAARQEIEKSRAEAPRRRRRWLLAVGGGPAGGGGGRFRGRGDARSRPATAARLAPAGKSRRIPANRLDRVPASAPRREALREGRRRTAKATGSGRESRRRGGSKSKP